MNIRHKIIRLLLRKEFYENNKHRIVREMFPKELGSLYDTIVEGHSRYERDMTLDEVSALHMTLHPTLTRATKTQVYELLLSIESDDSPLGEDLAKDVLQALWREEVGRRIADAGMALMDGTESSLARLERIIAQTGEDFLPVEDLDPVPDDMDEVLDALADRQCWRFNIPSLARHVAGGAGGDFIIAFARPEVGKTAFHVSLACAPGGFCHQGANVVALVNEEPGIRTKGRAITACTGVSREELLDDPVARDVARPVWNQIRGNYTILDSVDFTMERLDAYCRKARPDVLIIDQLDKVAVGGSYARVDQRLREIYTRAREIAKRYNILVIAISQASADAEGKTKLHYSMMEESKTGKAAEADLIIGIGTMPIDQQSDDDTQRLRYLTVSKNKITGWHGTVTVVLEGKTSVYHE